MPDLYLATQMFTIYAKREDAPKSFKDAKDANYTFHHIMPYCYAALIGHVVDTVIRKGILDQEDATARTLAGNLDLLCSTLIASEYSNADVRRTDPNDAKQSFVHKFAWMGANLFMGPEGQWRLDDPKHDCEANRPCSFDRDAWQQLMDIHKLLDQSFDVSASGQGYTATPKMNLAWTGPGNFLTSEIGLIRRLKSLVTGYSHTPHPFKMDDWIVVDSDAPEWKRTELKLTDDEVKIGQAKQTLLNLELQHKVNYLRPVAIKGVDREYPNMAQASRARQGPDQEPQRGPRTRGGEEPLRVARQARHQRRRRLEGVLAAAQGVRTPGLTPQDQGQLPDRRHGDPRQVHLNLSAP